MSGDAAPAPLVLADAERVGAVAAELVLNRLLARPYARCGLEPGRAPAAMFAALRAHAAAGELPSASRDACSQLVRREPAERCCARSSPASRSGRCTTLDDAAADLEAEAARHAALVDAAPLDLAVVGLDADGGVALDAPPARRARGVRVVPQPAGHAR